MARHQLSTYLLTYLMLMIKQIAVGLNVAKKYNGLTFLYMKLYFAVRQQK
jgi:hypothetical protein